MSSMRLKSHKWHKISDILIGYQFFFILFRNEIIPIEVKTETNVTGIIPGSIFNCLFKRCRIRQLIH